MMFKEKTDMLMCTRFGFICNILFQDILLFLNIFRLYTHLKNAITVSQLHINKVWTQTHTHAGARTHTCTHTCTHNNKDH